MSEFLYIFGRTPHLALAELQTFLPDCRLLNDQVAAGTYHIPIHLLGGTVKIAEIVDSLKIPEKSTFGISLYGGPQLSTSELDTFKKQYHAARYVATRGEPLTSVSIVKNKLQEFIFVRDGSKTIISKTLEVQGFESWNKRDYGRPYADPKSGMLPPKTARMIVNIAGVGKGKTLLDPFCGMGTVLAEALMTGWNVIGIDQLPAVIQNASANLRWLKENEQITGTSQLFTGDAVHASDILEKESVDAIVTEPYMGAAQRALPGGRINVKNIIKGLEKLYIGCLRDWHKILKKDGVVMIALPQYHIGGNSYFVKKVIDTCEILGYTIQAGPIEYGRPEAVVKRQFYLFKKIWHT